jgi:hypothetical protein
MLVTFHTDAWSRITMFGDVAVTLLKMTGHRGAIPGALLAADIPAALARLKRELAAASSDEARKPGRADDEETDSPPPVGLQVRAYPLIQLLDAAMSEKCDVMWSEGAPLVS